MMRITGMATGMDINYMVDELVKVKRMQTVDRYEKKRQQLEWQRDDYREINVKLTEFRESFRAKGLALQSTFLQKIVTSSDENSVIAKASGNAQNVTTTLEVSQLATAARWEAAKGIGEEVEQSDIEWVDGKTTLKFTVTKPGSDQPETVEVDMYDVYVSQDIAHVLSNSGVGVTAFYDEHEKKMVMSMNQTGAGAKIEIEDENTKKFMKYLGFEFDTDPDTATETNTLKIAEDGKNAKVKINGYATERSSNTFTLNGMTYTLKNVTTAPVTVSVATDTDKIYNDIMDFVNSYNELIEEIHGKLKEDRYRSFSPLTKQEKEAMTEDEIKLWEEKARSGLLRNSNILSSALTNLRTGLYGMVKGDAIGVFKDLSSIGLVSSKDWNDGGKIVVDTELRTYKNGERLSGEERLRRAIEEDPESLYKLFMADGETTEEKGILRRMRDTLDHAINSVAERAGRTGSVNHQFTIGRELDNVNKSITNYERRLKEYEDRLFKQFNAMENAVQRYNSQAESLFAFMSNGSM